MSDVTAALATLLRCLDREDVTELQLFTGKVVGAVRAQGVIPLTRVPLTAAHIDALLAQSPLAEALARNSGVFEVCDVALAGRSCRATLSRRKDAVQVRISRFEPASASEVAKATASSAHQASLLNSPLLPVSAGTTNLATDLVHDMAVALTEANTANQPPEPKGPAPGGLDFMSAQIQALPILKGPDDGAVTIAPDLMALLDKAWQQQASDVHIACLQPPKMRVAGQLLCAGDPWPASVVEPLLLALLSGSERALLQQRGYVDRAAATDKGRLRINISRVSSGLKGCLRLIPRDVPTLASLQLPVELTDVAKLHQGLVIVSGPAGHGKSSTLTALVNLLNMRSAHHIITVEDPIEAVHPIGKALISQREVGQHTASFARALKASLREDPDIIVIGELRDQQSVEIALTAAETGHLVLTTMNTRSASRTIDRLIDLFLPEDQPQIRATLAATLRLVICQRLVPTVGGGLVPAVELVSHSVPLAALIRDNKLFQLSTLMQRGRSAGMLKLDTSLVELVHAGHIDIQVARQLAEHPQELDRALMSLSAATKQTLSAR